jgi:hypothetical protein
MGVAGIALIGTLATGFYTYANRNRELDIKLVEIGIGILRADPKKSGLTAARSWAIQVIEENSGVQFDEEDRQTLRQKPLLYRSGTITPGFRGYDFSPDFIPDIRDFRKRKKPPDFIPDPIQRPPPVKP